MLVFLAGGTCAKQFRGGGALLARNGSVYYFHERKRQKGLLWVLVINTKIIHISTDPAADIPQLNTMDTPTTFTTGIFTTFTSHMWTST
jgi:hypothetical protein